MNNMNEMLIEKIRNSDVVIIGPDVFYKGNIEEEDDYFSFFIYRNGKGIDYKVNKQSEFHKKTKSNNSIQRITITSEDFYFTGDIQFLKYI